MSEIFLSFSNLEGIGIPPVEAALSGNKVIGYTGGGGIEYWKEPIFTKIENGEIRPSKVLADSMSSLLKGNKEFILIDDQKEVYEEAKRLAKKAKTGESSSHQGN